MPRLTLLALQVLVAVVGLVLWQLFATVPVFGRTLLPPFFFPRPSMSVARSSSGSAVA